MYSHNFLKFKKFLSYSTFLICLSHSLSALEVTNTTGSQLDCRVSESGAKVKEKRLNAGGSFSISSKEIEGYKRHNRNPGDFHFQCLHVGLEDWQDLLKLSSDNLGGKYNIANGPERQVGWTKLPSLKLEKI